MVSPIEEDVDKHEDHNDQLFRLNRRRAASS